MNVTMIKGVVTRGLGRGLLITRKYSPEILIGTGIVAIVGSTVLACKATLKADEVLDETKANLDKIHRAKEVTAQAESEGKPVVNYTEMDYKRDLAVAYKRSAVGFIKLYGPSVTLGVAGIACILGAHGIMRRRNVALIAAYKAVERSFSDYRKRVAEEFGEEKERMLKAGIVEKKMTVIKKDEKTGKAKKVEETVQVLDPNGISQYARFFDEDSSSNWSPTPGLNSLFLKCQQQNATDMLHSRGHVFLNEVYDMLGLKRSTEGSVVGWVLGNGDDFIDFGMYDTSVAAFRTENDNNTVGELRRDFVNGCEMVKSVLLDFNVDGVIYDKI